MFVVINLDKMNIISCFVIIASLPYILSEEAFDSSSEDFRDNIHNGKFVIYDQIDRQMVESSMDEVMADHDESFPFMTRVLPDYSPKDTQTIHTYMLPPENEHHFSDFESSLEPMETSDGFGYRVNGNHQIQVEQRPTRNQIQRGKAQFIPAESVQNSMYAPSFMGSIRPAPYKPRPAPNERPSMAPTPFVKSQAERPGLVSFKPFNKSHDKLNDKLHGKFHEKLNEKFQDKSNDKLHAKANDKSMLASLIKPVHVAKEDDKSQLIKPQQIKKYFPEPVKMLAAQRFESLRLKSVPATLGQVTTTTMAPLTYHHHHHHQYQVNPANQANNQMKVNSRFPIGRGESNNHNNNNHGNGFNPSQLMANNQFNNFNHHHGFKLEEFESNNHLNPSIGNNNNFNHYDDFEDMSASEEVASHVKPSSTNHHPSLLEMTHHTPTSTRIAVQNHPDLTEKQRDSLLKILESYYKLIHQFNIDFKRLIDESQRKANSKQNGTIIIEPLALDPAIRHDKVMSHNLFE